MEKGKEIYEKGKEKLQKESIIEKSLDAMSNVAEETKDQAKDLAEKSKEIGAQAMD